MGIPIDRDLKLAILGALLGWDGNPLDGSEAADWDWVYVGREKYTKPLELNRGPLLFGVGKRNG